MKGGKVLNLGEFRKLTANLPDETPLIQITHQVELGVEWVDVEYVEIEKAVKKQKDFVDDFNQVMMPVEVYEKDEKGIPVIKIR